MSLHGDAGDKIICVDCGDHVATLARTPQSREPLSVDLFTDEGQGPWKVREPARCKKCGQLFFANGRFIGLVRQK